MCGIGGYARAAPTPGGAAAVAALLAGLRARGPDDEGVCLVSRDGRRVRPAGTPRTRSTAGDLPALNDALFGEPHDVALVNTRLAILDLSAAAHQPFVSADGGVVATYNGEIYNYQELRAALTRQGVRLRSTGDTEVLVEGYRAWGHDLWRRLNGFWAVALVDLPTGELVLARDRLGIAPLYLRERPDGLYFASLIRPLLAASGRADPNDEVVRGFLETGLRAYDEETCFRGVYALPPATVLCFPPGAVTRAAARARRIWDYPSRRLATADLPFAEAATRLRDTLFDAVRLRLRADVPVACELSGGLDSSSIAAAAAELAPGSLVTYTISVPEADEEPYARRLRDRYGHDYRVLRDVEAPLVADATRFAGVVEEPYHSPNIYTHFRMRERMRQDGVVVVLTGSGGDEVLAGYEWDFWPAAAAELRDEGRRAHALAHHLALRLGTPARVRSTIAGYARRLTGAGGEAVPSAPATRAARLRAGYATLDLLARQRFHCAVGDLPYYLSSNDHFTMAIPLEHRLPFLDHRMVELGLQLPAAYLFRGGWSKYVLRHAMGSYLPRRILRRREKQGFPFPLRRFLTTHAGVLAPLLDDVRAAGFPVAAGYDALRERDPLRLWRACSTGLWLRAA